ncbi:unknown [Prevotella sp. CAG:1124]|nr:unknown [Prevotella sp. CAG:1124]
MKAERCPDSLNIHYKYAIGHQNSPIIITLNK